MGSDFGKVSFVAQENFQTHQYLKAPITPPFKPHSKASIFGMGCFWGAEKKFWVVPGVEVTAVGYAGGHTLNPNYQQVCSGTTGHVEVVLVVWDPDLVSYTSLLKVFWESHDPTQGMRQGNDVGSQYRSAIFENDDELLGLALRSKAAFNVDLTVSGYDSITTEISPAETFFYAEEYHQQYLLKNPNGYCGIGGTGVACLLDEIG